MFNPLLSLRRDQYNRILRKSKSNIVARYWSPIFIPTFLLLLDELPWEKVSSDAPGSTLLKMQSLHHHGRHPVRGLQELIFSLLSLPPNVARSHLVNTYDGSYPSLSRLSLCVDVAPLHGADRSGSRSFTISPTIRQTSLPRTPASLSLGLPSS